MLPDPEAVRGALLNGWCSNVSKPGVAEPGMGLQSV
jgi:hypothetical protein